MLKRNCWLITIVALVVAAPGLIQERKEPPATIVLLVRHAEKAAEPPGDPALTPEGTKRAAKLLQVAGDSGVRTIYATQFLRTQRTVEPLAAKLGIAVTQREASDVDGLVADILAHHRGEVVLVAGHSNTIPDIIKKLGGGTVPAIADTEFDNLYVVTVPREGDGRTVRLHFGEPQ